MKKDITKYVLISIFVVSVFIFISARTSSGAVDLSTCSNCHGTIKPIPSYNLTKNCLRCHDTHGTPKGCCQPKIRDSEKVHEIHAEAGKKVPQNYENCVNCHQSPVSCINCHNSHDNIKLNASDIDNFTICTDCHGQLPQSGGHEEFRESLSKYKHNWTSCNTCHVSPYKDATGVYKFDLHFKNLFKTSIDNSIELCKICHSLQYEKLKEGNHGEIGSKCVDCHNPHTTKLTGPEAIITPTETPVNISTKVESAKGWITEKVPILNNPVALVIVAIILASIVFEYVLSKYEVGTKTAYNMIKISAKEETLKTLEVKLKNQNIDIVRRILEEFGFNILGMTMKKDEDKEEYKYVIFVDTRKLIMNENDENNLINRVSSESDTKSVEFTDKYEL